MVVRELLFLKKHLRMSIPFVPSPLQVMENQQPQGFPTNSEVNRNHIGQPIAGPTQHNQKHPNKRQQEMYHPGAMPNNNPQPVLPAQQMTKQFGQMTVTETNSAKITHVPGPIQTNFPSVINGSSETSSLGKGKLCQPPSYQSTNFSHYAPKPPGLQQEHFRGPPIQSPPASGVSNMKMFVCGPNLISSSPSNVQQAPSPYAHTLSPPLLTSSLVTSNQVQTTYTTIPPPVSAPAQAVSHDYRAPNQNKFSSSTNNFPCSSPSQFSTLPGSFPPPPGPGPHGMNSPFPENLSAAPTPVSQFPNAPQPNFGKPAPPPQQFPPHSMSRPAYPGAFPPLVNQQQAPGIVQRQPYPSNIPPGSIQSPQQALSNDMMPNTIAVRKEDQRLHGGPFHTGNRGQVPPLVTTDFIVRDEGICSPRFLCSTIYSVPCQPEMLKQSHLPFALVVSPFADIQNGEMVPPIADLQEQGPVRCNRCRAYMCPYMTFIDGGRKFQCAFCDGITEVPQEYFAYLDTTGQRTDKYQRPELCLGSYEFIATKDYCKNGVFPNPPAFVFMIDVSYNSIKSGFVDLLCQNMKDILKELPRDGDSEFSAVRVGFVTYNDTVHFYNVKGKLSQPQMMLVSDVSDMFVPLVDGFLVSPEEAEAVITSLMEQIPQMFAETKQTEVILGPIIQAGLDALKAAECCGKIFIFHSSLPLAEAPGKLKNREDRALLGTEKEKMVLNPQVPFYTTTGYDCVAAGCSVDLFLFPHSYIDVATIGEVCRLTGGQIYKYSCFQADADGDRFLEDLKNDIKHSTVFDAVMRVRTSAGIRATDFYGNFYMANTTDVELATIDDSKSIVVEIKYDDKLPEGAGAFVQVATLYTSCSGQRRIRINNLALNTCTQMADLFQSCMLDSIVHFFTKRALKLLLDQMPLQIKDGIISMLSNILAAYRKTHSTSSSPSQLILPESLKLLPLYINCILKSDAVFGGSDLTTDDRSFAMFAVNSMGTADAIGYLYPRLISLHDIDTSAIGFPTPLRCSMAYIKDNGAYLLENGVYMFMWIGQAIAPNWVQEVFGLPGVANIGENPKLPELETLISQKVRSIIDDIRQERKRHLKLFIIRQGDKLDIVFRQFLVEDRVIRTAASYVEFLCQVQQEICKLSS